MIKNSQQIILEFDAITGVLEFDRFININFNPHEMKINYVVRHNITGPTNTGLASLYVLGMPIKNLIGPLFTMSQQNDHIDPKTSFYFNDNTNINGNYLFRFVLGTGALLDANIAVFLEFVEYHR